MFGKKRKVVSDIDTLIGANTVITGDIQFAGGLRVDGRISGSIMTTGNKQHSLLVLSEQGVVEGKIKVPYLVINGTVKGPIHSNENLELQPGAKITGDIYYKTIKIHQGAVVEGKMVCRENPQPEKLITYVVSAEEQKERAE
ncbi:polymer-forming cytoskeletal protein [Nitrosomonas sp. HPC101]|uniref:bactofilin family protein n=1 Tax=Nitrosomonas sp. HPC101 TaxID=1658667 RepID=UPI00137226F3|nr:polymer-forming cytoskeletal protein [Nitrosomonas sp. HPC101]MXS84605.1 polymer-forming cytoskeletal protein [Nitrosomonas sp. HPC101]